MIKSLFRCSLAAVVFFAMMAIAVESNEDTGVKFFEGSLEEALDQAKQVDLPLFVYLSIPECVGCEYMATKTFAVPLVRNFMDARFVSFKLDAYDENANGPTIAQTYRVGGYPTYLILDLDGTVQYRATGSMNAENFVRSISWLTGETSSPMEDHFARYATGDRDPEFVQQYLLDSIVEIKLMPKDMENWKSNWEAIDKAEEKYKAIASEYLDSKPSKDLINSTDLSIIAMYFKYPNEKGIEFVIDNFDAYVDQTSLERISSFLLRLIADVALIRAMEGNPAYVELIDSLEDEPLKRATAFERSRDPESHILPENQREHLAETFTFAIQETSEPETQEE